MPELATVIRGVDAVLPDARRIVDLGIDTDGRIAALGSPASGALDAPTVIDAEGLVAIPGGIDLHVHIDTYFGGTTTRDDFYVGTDAALYGGTTTVAQFAIPRPGETSLDALARTRAAAGPLAATDLAIHGCVVRETYDASLGQFEELVAAGVGTVKIFSAYTDVIGLSLERIERLLARAAETGITVFVHAETDAMVRKGIDDAVEHGDLGPLGHAESRSPEAEADAVGTIAGMAVTTGARVYFVHISSEPSVRALAGLRARQAPVLAETCPHYLFLDEAVYRRHDGQRWISSPPIRGDGHREALWMGLREGVIDTVSSDHNCFDLAQKGPDGLDFRRVPNGLPGIEYRMPLLIGAAIDGRLEWHRLMAVASETPARILGAWPRKGSLRVGADADIVLIDPAGRTDLGRTHMATDYSPYEGSQTAGRIRSVFRRGECVVHDGISSAAPGSGAWIPVPAAQRVK